MNEDDPTIIKSLEDRSKEIEVPSIPFRELTAELKRKRGFVEREGINHTDNHFFWSIKNQQGEEIPVIGVQFDPPIRYGRSQQLKAKLFHVTDPGTYDYLSSNYLNPTNIWVYDVSIEQFLDPEFNGEIYDLKAANIPVVADPNDAPKIKSWVADPKMREHIIAYAKRQDEVVDALTRRGFHGGDRTKEEIIDDE
jgi:hypothetical protein